jgi:Tol biopolymer transport system component
MIRAAVNGDRSMGTRRWVVVVLAVVLVAAVAAAQDRSPAQRFQQAIDLMATRGDYPAAIRLFEEIAKGQDRSLAARSLLYIGLCDEKLGKQGAKEAYQRLVREFPDQPEALAEARSRLAAMARSSLTTNSLLIRRVVEGPEADFQGGPSLDGRQFTYVDFSAGNLAVMDLTTGVKRHLTDKKSWSESADFARYSVISPDGKQVAYSWFNSKDELFELRIVSMEGDKPRVLYHNAETISPQPAAWSADGKQILAALTGKDGSTKIAWVALADGAVQVIKQFGWRRPSRMSLSPDGRWVAYDYPPKEDEPQRDIFLLSSDGRTDIPLVEHPANDRAPVWTPDGKEVLFLSDRTGVFALWGIAVAGGRGKGSPVLLRRDVGTVVPLGMTALGGYYYGASNGTYDVYAAELDPATGNVASPPHPASRTLVGGTLSPAWSADGRQLAFVSGMGPIGFANDPLALTILSLESGEQRQLLPRLGIFGRLRWSPDGHSLLAMGQDVGNRGGLFQIDVQTGQVTPIVYGSVLQGYPRQAEWAPDGKGIFYSAGGQTLLRDLHTGQEKQVYAGMVFALSRDGKWLAFHAEDRPAKSSVLKVVSADGGPARELLRLPGSGVFTLGMAWSADGRYLLFVKANPLDRAQPHEVWRIAAQGGEPQRLDIAMPGLVEIRVHPDGRRIAFSAGMPKPEIWAMENLLPMLQAAFGNERETQQVQTKKSPSKLAHVR